MAQHTLTSYLISLIKKEENLVKPDIMMLETSKIYVLIKKMIKNKSEVNKYIGELNEIFSIF